MVRSVGRVVASMVCGVEQETPLGMGTNVLPIWAGQAAVGPLLGIAQDKLVASGKLQTMARLATNVVVSKHCGMNIRHRWSRWACHCRLIRSVQIMWRLLVAVGRWIGIAQGRWEALGMPRSMERWASLAAVSMGGGGELVGEQIGLPK